MTDWEQVDRQVWQDKATGRVLSLREGLTLDDYLARQEQHPPTLLDYGDFERRWTDDELSGLFDARKISWQVDRYITLAAAQGHVNLSGPTASAAKDLFVEMGILTEERAAVVFAA